MCLMKIKADLNLLKLIAIATMTIDHIGLFFFTYPNWWRIVGRLAMPIFVYLIATGIHQTRNLTKYIINLVVLAVVMQVILFQIGLDYFNIVWGFLLLIWLVKAPIWLKFMAFLPFLWLNIEYNLLTLGLGLIFYHLKNPIWRICLGSIAIIIYGWSSPMIDIQYWAILSLIIIEIINKIAPIINQNRFLKQKLPKYLFYVYYPGHFYFLYLLYVTMK